MRIFDLPQNFDRVPCTGPPHRRNEIAEPVDRKQRGAFKRRDEKRTGEMRAMVLDVMKLCAQVRRFCSQSLGEFIFQIMNPRRIAKTILDLPENASLVPITISA